MTLVLITCLHAWIPSGTFFPWRHETTLVCQKMYFGQPVDLRPYETDCRKMKSLMINWFSNPAWCNADHSLPSAMMDLIERQLPHKADLLLELHLQNIVALVQYAATNDNAGIKAAAVNYQRSKFMLVNIAQRRVDFHTRMVAFLERETDHRNTALEEYPVCKEVLNNVLRELDT